MSDQPNNSSSWKSQLFPIAVATFIQTIVFVVTFAFFIGELYDRMDNLEHRISKLEVRMTAIEIKVGDLSERVAKIEGLLQGWQSRPVEISQNPVKP